MTIFSVVLICVIILSVFQIVLAIIFYDFAINTRKDRTKQFEKGKNQVIIPELTVEEKELLKTAKDVYIKSNDNLKLHALELKSELNKDWIIITHGYFSKAEHLMPYAIELIKNHNLLLIELRGHGKSEGKYIDFGIKSRYDILNWIDYINYSYNNPKIGLYGLSMGASSIMMTTNFTLPKNIKFIIEDSGFTSAKEELQYQLRKVFHFPAFPTLMLANSYIKMKHGFTINDGSAINALRYNNVPILFIHGDDDKLVPTYMINKLYEANAGIKDKLIIKNAGHIGSMFKSKEEYWNKINKFIIKNEEI